MVSYLPWILTHLIRYSCHEPAFSLKNQLHPAEPISTLETRWVKLSSQICLDSDQPHRYCFSIDLAYEKLPIQKVLLSKSKFFAHFHPSPCCSCIEC